MKWCSVIAIIILAIVLFGCLRDSQQVLTEPNYTVFVPLVLNRYSQGTNIGVETESKMSSVGQYYNPNTLLKTRVRMAEVWADPSHWNWYPVDMILGSYYADWLTVKSTPSWMRADGIECKLPERQFWADTARFYQAVINRYHPKFLEIWNEPNADTQIYPTQFGCIADGTAYGEFVDYIYENVSGAEIIMGAVTSPYDEPFVSDMFEAVGVSYDGFSFHCYEHHKYFTSDWCPKIYDYASTLTDKPVYLSETAVLFKYGNEQAYEWGQIQHYERLKSLPTPGFWYTVCGNGWPVEMPTDICGRPVHDFYMDE